MRCTGQASCSKDCLSNVRALPSRSSWCARTVDPGTVEFA